MELHRYDNGPLTEGADCGLCAAPLLDGGQHVESAAHPGVLFCRDSCAETFRERERRKKTSQPGQVGFALD